MTNATRNKGRLRKAWRMRSQLLRIVKSHIKYSENAEGTVWGSLTEADEAVLRRWVREAAGIPGPIVEIGTLFGFTTELIATAKETHQALIAVENFQWNPLHLSQDDHRTFTRRNLRYCLSHATTTLYDGDKADFYADYQGDPPALVFIDAGHRYADVCADLQWAQRMRVPLITGHDYSPRHPGVIQAVDEHFGERVQLQPGSSVWAVDLRTG